MFDTRARTYVCMYTGDDGCARQGGGGKRRGVRTVCGVRCTIRGRTIGKRRNAFDDAAGRRNELKSKESREPYGLLCSVNLD